MANKPGKINWKQRLEAMKQKSSSASASSVEPPLEPPLQEISPVETAPPRLSESPDTLAAQTPEPVAPQQSGPEPPPAIEWRIAEVQEAKPAVPEDTHSKFSPRPPASLASPQAGQHDAVKPEPSLPVSVPPPEPPATESVSSEAAPTRLVEPAAPSPLLEKIHKVKRETSGVKPITASQEPPVSYPDLLSERVNRLEQKIRSLKVLGIMAALLAMIALMGLAFMIQRGPGREDGMSGKTLSIFDTKGTVRAWVGERDGQVQVELKDQAGRRRLSLGLGAEGEPKLTFYGEDQKILGEIVSLPDKQPGIKILNQASEAVGTVAAPSPPVATPPSSPDSTPQSTAPVPTPLSQESPQQNQQTELKPETPSMVGPEEFFLAAPGGRAYHRASCPWVKNISPDNLRKFSSGAEAARAGLYPCRRCRPDLQRPKE